MRAAALVLLAVLVLSGCADQQEDQVVQAVRAFSDALTSGDAATACSALAPLTREELERSQDQPCEQALVAEELMAVQDVTAVERYGRQGSAVVSGPGGESDTWFLSRFDGRWLLVAASCEPRGDLPYACDLEGP